jgi:hypothetical protein
MNDLDFLSVVPDEDFYVYIDMDTDQSGVIPSIVVEEFNWPYKSNVYQFIETEEITSGFIIEDTDLVTNGRIKIKISTSMSENWQNRKLWFKMLIDDGTDKWCVSSRTISIINRD